MWRVEIMGSLADFSSSCVDLRDLKQNLNIDIFVETGCFRGNSISYALELGFNKIFSCDIDREMIDHCYKRFGYEKPIYIYQGDSISFFEMLLPKLPKIPVLFYLDAHLPEHDKNNGQVILETELNFPLKDELRLINKYRDTVNDVIVCDDLRIYEDGPFQGGNWKDRPNNVTLDLSFLSDYNYKVSKFYSQEGYILLTK